MTKPSKNKIVDADDRPEFTQEEESRKRRGGNVRKGTEINLFWIEEKKKLKSIALEDYVWWISYQLKELEHF